jgi:hypothetical protein
MICGTYSNAAREGLFFTTFCTATVALVSKALANAVPKQRAAFVIILTSKKKKKKE